MKWCVLLRFKGHRYNVGPILAVLRSINIQVVLEANHGLHYSYTRDYVSISYIYGLAGVCAVPGLLFVKTYYRDLFQRYS